ncbi:MAG: hypothetical protein FWE40_00565 [Oscillospiraceae bacterium]|jgi:hypothetical protein|nr:hypothetical protein [Oscillospiraceae bacterium]
MKHTKRLLALVLTLTLAFGLAVPAMANVTAPAEVLQATATSCDDIGCILQSIWQTLRPWAIIGSIVGIILQVISLIVIIVLF